MTCTVAPAVVPLSTLTVQPVAVCEPDHARCKSVPCTPELYITGAPDGYAGYRATSSLAPDPALLVYSKSIPVSVVDGKLKPGEVTVWSLESKNCPTKPTPAVHIPVSSGTQP